MIDTKKLLQEFDDRHSVCIGSDGDYSDEDIINVLKAHAEYAYKKDREIIVSLIKEIK